MFKYILCKEKSIQKKEKDRRKNILLLDLAIKIIIGFWLKKVFDKSYCLIVCLT